MAILAHAGTDLNATAEDIPDWATMVTELPLMTGGTGIEVVDSRELSLKL